ncbi:unnamed protein product [Caenorhabditis bovis]|nr:unnamed protein product [Caenorhabditis bovis]
MRKSETAASSSSAQSQQQTASQRQHQKPRQTQRENGVVTSSAPLVRSSSELSRSTVENDIKILEQLLKLVRKLREYSLKQQRECLKVMEFPRVKNGTKIEQYNLITMKTFEEIQRIAKTPMRRNPNVLAGFNHLTAHQSMVDNNFWSRNECSTMDEIVDASAYRDNLEKTSALVYETFKQPLIQKKSMFAVSPPVSINNFAGIQQKFVQTMETLKSKMNREKTFWKFTQSNELSLSGACLTYEVVYSPKMSAGGFVPYFKSMICVKNGLLADLVIGATNEKLMDEDGTKPSKYVVYRQMTKFVKRAIVERNRDFFKHAVNFYQCNNYIQQLTTCMKSPCHRCRKLLNNFMPPTMLVAEDSSFLLYHPSCYMYKP